MTLANRSWFVLVPLLLLIWFAHFFVDSMLGIWHVYKSMAGLDLGKAGIIVAVGAFIGEGAQLLFGSFSDRGYRKALMVLGVCGVVSSTFLAYTSNYAVLFILYLLTCIGSGAFHPASASLVSTLNPSRRGLLLAIYASGGYLGLAGSQLIFTQAHTLFDGNTAVMAIPAILIVGFFLFTRLPTPQNDPAVSRPPVKFSNLFKLFKKPHFCSLYFSQVANQSILWGTIFILPDVLKEFGFAESIYYGGGHLFFILGGACMLIPAGYLADRYSAKLVMTVAGVISFVAFYGLILTGNISLSMTLAMLFVLGSTLSLMNPIGIALGTRYEPHQSGTVSAFLMGLVWCVSEAVGPGSVGMMSNLFSDYAPVKALAVLGGLFVLQIYATARLPQEEQAVLQKV